MIQVMSYYSRFWITNSGRNCQDVKTCHLVTGKKEEEGVVPCSWIDEERQNLYWPQDVNAEIALSSRQHPASNLVENSIWLKWKYLQVGVNLLRFFFLSCIQQRVHRLLLWMNLNGESLQRVEKLGTWVWTSKLQRATYGGRGESLAGS